MTLRTNGRPTINDHWHGATDDEADRIDDGDPGRRVPGAGRPRRGPARRVRAGRLDRGLRRSGDVAVPDLVVRAGRRATPRAPDLGDLGDVLAAPRQRRSGLTRDQRPA